MELFGNSTKIQLTNQLINQLINILEEKTPNLSKKPDDLSTILMKSVKSSVKSGD